MANYPIIDESTCQPNGSWVHDACGTELQGKRVYHSVHDGPFALSGHGEVESELVPYCPKCQGPPNEMGSPVRQRQVDVDEAAILRRMRDGSLPPVT